MEDLEKDINEAEKLYKTALNYKLHDLVFFEERLANTKCYYTLQAIYHQNKAIIKLLKNINSKKK